VSSTKEISAHRQLANTTYARSVQPKTIQPGALPDPGLIFDRIFARHQFTKHPNNVSSILFYWGSLIVHDLFQTDYSDMNNSQMSFYLDLSPLYGDVSAVLRSSFESPGELPPHVCRTHDLEHHPPLPQIRPPNNIHLALSLSTFPCFFPSSAFLVVAVSNQDVQTWEDQKQIRTFKDGELKPDCFAEGRLLAFSPGCGVLLIMFNRYHNYVVEQLAVINENRHFTKPSDNLPPEKAEQAWTLPDGEIVRVSTLHRYYFGIVSLAAKQPPLQV